MIENNADKETKARKKRMYYLKTKTKDTETRRYHRTGLAEARVKLILSPTRKRSATEWPRKRR